MVALTETEIELFFFLVLPRLVRILQRNKTIRIYVCIQRFSIRNWLMWLWRLTNPKSCRVSLQARDIGEPMVQFHFQSGGWQAQDPERAYVSVQFLGQEKKKKCPSPKAFRQEEGRTGLFVLFMPSTDRMRPTQIRESNSFTQSIDMNVNLSPHRRTQNNFLTNNLGILCSSQVRTR